MTQTKVDVTRIIQMWIDDGRGDDCFWEGWPECPTPEDELTPNMIRALLDAKEAAEREVITKANELASSLISDMQAARDEARAAAAAAWEAGKCAAAEWVAEDTAVADMIRDHVINPTPEATEALRAVKEAVWNEGFDAGCCAKGGDQFDPNPYAKKDTA